MSDGQDLGLDLVLKRAGITLPPGRRRGVLATYRDLQAMLPILRGPRIAAAEPAGTYVIDTVTRDRTP